MILYAKLYEHTINQGETLEPPAGHTAFWIQSGTLSDGSKQWGANDGFYPTTQPIICESQTSALMCFNFHNLADNIDTMKPLLQSECVWPDGPCILRLDSVTFPKGAIAYRHIHAGAGVRFLIRGNLAIKSDHSVEQMAKGDAWFEDANSPVKATATETQTSQFIRALILPIEYEGKPTITFLNPEDIDKPKEQTNHRFFDQRITL